MMLQTHNPRKDDVLEKINVMINQEKTTYVCRDYMKDPVSRNINSVTEVNEICREKIVGWYFQVVDYYHIDREAVAISISYLDRFLSMNHCDKKKFKLAASTALYLAVKINEPNKADIMKVLPRLSRKEFCFERIKKMEIAMLKSLSWRLNPPTPGLFVQLILELLPSTMTKSSVDEISNIATFFTQLSHYDYYFAIEYPCTIAFAAILNALEALCFEVSPSTNWKSFLNELAESFDLRYDSKDVVNARMRLWILDERDQDFSLRNIPQESERKKRKCGKIQDTLVVTNV